MGPIGGLGFRCSFEQAYPIARPYPSLPYLPYATLTDVSQTRTLKYAGRAPRSLLPNRLLQSFVHGVRDRRAGTGPCQAPKGIEAKLRWEEVKVYYYP